MKKPSRRAVVRTGVWAVPVVAAAAPARAGTTTPQVEIQSMGSGCQLPGRSMHDGETFFDYRMVVTFDNRTAAPQVIALIRDTADKTPDGRRTLINPKKAVAAAQAKASP